MYRFISRWLPVAIGMAFGAAGFIFNSCLPPDRLSLFSPPVEFKNDLGPYRSPLTFYDGRPVKTKGDWKRRRAEILGRWHQLMGPWPPLLKDQRLEMPHRDFAWQLTKRGFVTLSIGTTDATREKHIHCTIPASAMPRYNRYRCWLMLPACACQ